MVETASGWIRSNLGLAAGVIALLGTILGGIVAGTLWLASVEHLETRVNVIRADLTVMRATMEDNRKIVGDVRRQLEATDAALNAGLGRVDERLKSLEKGK